MKITVLYLQTDREIQNKLSPKALNLNYPKPQA